MRKQSTSTIFYLHSNSPAFKKVYQQQGFLLYPVANTKEEAIKYAEYLIKRKSTIVPKFKTFWIEKETVITTVIRKKVYGKT